MDISTMAGMLLEGFGVSAQVFALTLLGSIPLGIPVALARLSRFKPLQLLARAFISVMRGTPLMLQMFAVYFAPYYVFGIQLTTQSKWQACIIAFIINYAAYFAEIYRSGIQSIPRGQYEAAEVLGYTKAQTFMKIVLPQVIKRILPAMSNEVITLVKDTSLANVIANKEIIMMAKEYSAKGLIWPLFSTAIFFLVFVGALTLLLDWAEKKMDYFRC